MKILIEMELLQLTKEELAVASNKRSYLALSVHGEYVCAVNGQAAHFAE